MNNRSNSAREIGYGVQSNQTSTYTWNLKNNSKTPDYAELTSDNMVFRLKASALTKGSSAQQQVPYPTTGFIYTQTYNSSTGILTVTIRSGSWDAVVTDWGEDAFYLYVVK